MAAAELTKQSIGTYLSTMYNINVLEKLQKNQNVFMEAYCPTSQWQHSLLCASNNENISLPWLLLGLQFVPVPDVPGSNTDNHLLLVILRLINNVLKSNIIQQEISKKLDGKTAKKGITNLFMGLVSNTALDVSFLTSGIDNLIQRIRAREFVSLGDLGAIANTLSNALLIPKVYAAINSGLEKYGLSLGTEGGPSTTFTRKRDYNNLFKMWCKDPNSESLNTVWCEMVNGNPLVIMLLARLQFQVLAPNSHHVLSIFLETLENAINKISADKTKIPASIIKLIKELLFDNDSIRTLKEKIKSNTKPLSWSDLDYFANLVWWILTNNWSKLLEKAPLKFRILGKIANAKVIQNFIHAKVMNAMSMHGITISGKQTQ